MNKVKIIVVVLILAVVVVGILFAQNVPAGNLRWEYRSVGTNGGPNIGELNRLGTEGWEVVSNWTSNNGYGLVLKRRLP